MPKIFWAPNSSFRYSLFLFFKKIKKELKHAAQSGAQICNQYKLFTKI